MNREAAVKSFYENTETYLGQDYNIRIRTETVNELLSPFQTFENVLDMPCGNGNISLQNAEKFDQLTLVDFSENMIQEAKKNASSVNHNQLTFICNDIFNTNFPDSSFDLVISLGILAHINNPKKLLEELTRITKPGGKIIIQNTSSSHPYGKWIHRYQKIKSLLGKSTYQLNKIPSEWLETEMNNNNTTLLKTYRYNQSFLGFGRFFSNEKKYRLTRKKFGTVTNNTNADKGSDYIYLFQKN